MVPTSAAIPVAVKGQFTPRPNIHIFPLTFSAFYLSKLFWCELQSFGDTGRGDVYFLSDIKELCGDPFFLLNSIHQLYHCTVGSVHLLMSTACFLLHGDTFGGCSLVERKLLTKCSQQELSQWRQTTLSVISPKLCNSYQNNLTA